MTAHREGMRSAAGGPAPPVRPSLRRALAETESGLVASFVLVPRVEIVESLAYAGFDGVVIDLEHGPITVAELPALVAAGHGAGTFVLARVPEDSAGILGIVLDTGVDGVVLPHVSSVEDARAAVDLGRYPPDGSRSLNPYIRAAHYSADDSFTRDANDATAIMVMIEGKDGIAALPDIAGVEGIDAVFVGPVDLSASLGLPGQPEHPVVVERVAETLRIAADLGVGTAIYCPTPTAANRWLQNGARLAVLSADMAMASHGFRDYLRELNELTTGDARS